MASNIDVAFDEIFTQIKTTIPGATVLFEGQEAALINWQELIEDSALTLPYVIVSTRPAQPDPAWGMQNATYRLPVEIYYVQSRRSSTDNQRDVETVLEGLRDAFFAGSYTYVQMVDDPLIDCSEFNLANQYFLGNQKPLYAGMLQVQFLYGSTYA